MTENSCQVISAIQQKGGAGKTTLICTLASFLVEDGARVAIVDADPLEAAGDFAKQSEKLGLTVDYVHELDENEIVKAVRLLKDRDYDVIFIDTAGVDAKATAYSIQLSDLVLVPVKAARPDLKGLIRSLDTVETVSAIKEKEIPAFVVMSDVDKNTNITGDVLRAIQEKGYPLLSAHMHHRTGFKELMTSGGSLRGAARTVGHQVLGAMQIEGLLPYYDRPEAASKATRTRSVVLTPAAQAATA